MMTYEKALETVLLHTYMLDGERVSLLESAGRVLKEDVFSDISMPPFNRAAVDGFACRKSDITGELEVIETIRAGFFPTKKTGPGQCARIMTGAPVPEGADCILMVEETIETAPGMIMFTGKDTKTNISPLAEDVKEGEKVLSSGTLIAPQHIAIMAATGHVRPLVGCKPGVSVIATGDEIVEPDQKPGISQIRNSNGYQLTAQAERAGAKAVYLGIAPDNEAMTFDFLSRALEQSDVVLLTGGVSMGSFDFVPDILEKAGVEILFKTIALQPGKPTLFGVRGNKRIFGLPGNPVSSLTIFELFVRPMLLKMMGMAQPVRSLSMPIGQDYHRKRSDRMQWLPVKFSGGMAIPLEYHGSAHIFSFAEADGIAAIPLGTTQLVKGELIDVRPV